MASPNNPERRAAGVTFLGMQTSSVQETTQEKLAKWTDNVKLLEMIQRLEKRIARLELPWWKRLWIKIKGEFL
jgi:hypothetical protein